MASLDVVSAPLSPLRSAVLSALREPRSATEAAALLGESRQRVNYHVRELERRGLVELVEERPRRGCTERVMRATCHAVMVEPAVSGALPESYDRFSADGLMAVGARFVREVAAARASDEQVSTFAFEGEIGVSEAAELERFTEALAELAARFSGPRRYRVFAGGRPA